MLTELITQNSLYRAFSGYRAVTQCILSIQQFSVYRENGQISSVYRADEQISSVYRRIEQISSVYRVIKVNKGNNVYRVNKVNEEFRALPSHQAKLYQAS